MTQIETLYKQHYDDLLLAARKLLGNEEEARDAVSDVFAELLANGRPLREEQAASYLQVSVRNRCLNLLEHRRVVRTSEQLLRRRRAGATAFRFNPQDICETADNQEPPLDQVLDYVDTQLTAKTSNVVKQRYLGKKKYDEIAQDMGISRIAVFKHLSKGIHQLQAHFAWYQLVVVLLLLSGIVYAIIRSVYRTITHKEPHATTTEQPAPTSVSATTVHYENATLEEILTDIARYHHVRLLFQSDDSRHLRLYYDWQQQEPLADIVQMLDAFEGISMEYHDQTIYVE
jgi:RNA polymerase sigma-70 factor (ECF subfamily)